MLISQDPKFAPLSPGSCTGSQPPTSLFLDMDSLLALSQSGSSEFPRGLLSLPCFWEELHSATRLARSFSASSHSASPSTPLFSSCYCQALPGHARRLVRKESQPAPPSLPGSLLLLASLWEALGAELGGQAVGKHRAGKGL